jgi:hypothetical protein
MLCHHVLFPTLSQDQRDLGEDPIFPLFILGYFAFSSGRCSLTFPEI